MIDFTKVQNSVKALKDQLAANQIDEKTFEDRLLDLIDIAEDGHYWMFGHVSEQWFRHNGQTWVPDDPQKILTIRSQPSDDPAAFNPVEPTAESQDFSWTWFMVSLVVIIIIGVIVYSSGLG